MISPRSRSVLLSAVVASLTAACNCEQTRSARFTGHLGDSTTAVGIMTTAPGGVDFGLGEFDGKRYDTKSMTAKVNFSTFGDSVSLIRLADIADPARTPIVSFPRNRMTVFRFESVFDISAVFTAEDEAKFQTVWDIFARGDGLLEVVPYQGPAVRARIKPLAVGGWGDYCT